MGCLMKRLAFSVIWRWRTLPPNRRVYTIFVNNVRSWWTQLRWVWCQYHSALIWWLVTDGLKNGGKHDLAMRIEQLEVQLRGVWIVIKLRKARIFVETNIKTKQQCCSSLMVRFQCVFVSNINNFLLTLLESQEIKEDTQLTRYTKMTHSDEMMTLRCD